METEEGPIRTVRPGEGRVQIHPAQRIGRRVGVPHLALEDLPLDHFGWQLRSGGHDARIELEQ
jgi:hypothetical protein